MRRTLVQSFLRIGVDSDIERTAGRQASLQPDEADSPRLARSLLLAKAGCATTLSVAATIVKAMNFPVLIANICSCKACCTMNAY
jgi:hypothetical protein